MKHALLRTLAGRIILAGVAIRVIDFLLALALGGLPAPFRVIDIIAELAIAIGGAYFLVHLLAVMNRRLLWRVRHKLIISYFFIGLVPTLLVVAFFVLSGVFLFFNFSAYMVRSELRVISERTQSIARGVALDIERRGGQDAAGILQRSEAEIQSEFPGASMAVVRVDGPCTTPRTVRAAPRDLLPIAVAGPWNHVEPPTSIPAWIGCDGFTGLLVAVRGTAVTPANARLIVRAVAFPESTMSGYAVVVDLAADAAFRSQLRTLIGVDLEGIAQFTRNDPTAPSKTVIPLRGRENEEGDRQAGPGGPMPPLPSITYLEYHDWATGATDTLMASIRLGIGEIYGKISAAPGQDGIGNILILFLEVVGGLFLVMEIVALAMGLALAKSITGSVHELFAGTVQVRRGDFTHKIAVKADDQLGELAQSFNSMTASVEDLLIQSAEKKRLEEELRIAHEIQMSLLPQGPLGMPGISVAALCVPAREVGGDYYDFLPLGDHRLGVLIADVSGKGTSAALYMAELKGLMLSLSRIHSSPRELLIAADRIIAPHLDASSFITVTYAIIDLCARTMTYARAGHTPLIFLQAGHRKNGSGKWARILAPGGMVLGLKLDAGEMFERLLDEEVVPLERGDLFIMFTDGISEAMTRHDDFFGEHRLAQIAEEHADLPLEELRERIFREVQAFVGDAPQHDDMTMLLIRVEDETPLP